MTVKAASIPTPGAQGQKQAQQAHVSAMAHPRLHVSMRPRRDEAEKTSERLALEALELDPKNPHVGS